MKMVLQHIKSLVVCVSILITLIIFNKCTTDTKRNVDEQTVYKEADINFNQFAGSQICANCHKEITENYFKTAHFRTSQTASEKSITGSFVKSKNSFVYDVGKVVYMQSKNNSLYQTYYHNNKQVVSRRFDIVIGSGVRGQTYLSWIGNHIIELPVSYFTQIHQWANSPGYPLDPIIFNRPVTARCMECHSTYAEIINYNPEVPPMFDSTKMILSVSCEKCHGRAAKHVAYEQTHTNDTVGMFIINPNHLTKKLQLDVCALCHNGKMDEKKPPFQFVAGEKLNNFYSVNDAVSKAGVMDVHGNQLGVLSASKCFQLSKTITCTTCHDPHKNETANTIVYSQRCINCHANQHKPIQGLADKIVKNNCIDCHMPLQESTSISFLLQKNKPPVNAVMRTHYITIYNNETKKFIEQNTSSQKKKL